MGLLSSFRPRLRTHLTTKGVIIGVIIGGTPVFDEIRDLGLHWTILFRYTVDIYTDHSASTKHFQKPENRSRDNCQVLLRARDTVVMSSNPQRIEANIKEWGLRAMAQRY